MTDYPITCPECGRRVGWSDVEGVQIPCPAHAVDFTPTATAKPAEVHESTTTGVVVNSGCFGCLLPLMAGGLLTVAALVVLL